MPQPPPLLRPPQKLSPPNPPARLARNWLKWRRSQPQRAARRRDGGTNSAIFPPRAAPAFAPPLHWFSVRWQLRAGSSPRKYLAARGRYLFSSIANSLHHAVARTGSRLKHLRIPEGRIAY